MDEDVRNLLIAWVLSGYVDVFSENHIMMDCLMLLDSHIIKKLIPPVGHRVNFIKNLNNWKTLMDSENDNQSNQSQISENIHKDLEWLRKSSEPWKTVEEEKRKNTFKIRLEETKNITVSDYMNEHPVLKKPTGYQLLLIDSTF